MSTLLWISCFTNNLSIFLSIEFCLLVSQEVAKTLLDRCGHHPLTVAVMGKALRKEVRAEKWEKAISNLSTYATSAPGPISYVNEKEAETTVTIFGSLEFSLEVMPEDSRRLFIAFASLSWAEPLPEACLEAIWSVIGQENLFPLTFCKLVEGSLLMKTDATSVYQVHDMVSLYLNSKENDSVMLLTESTAEKSAFISPWLFIFGKDAVKIVSEKKIESSLCSSEEKQAIIILEAIIQAFMTSESISEIEATRAGLSRILGPKIGDLMSAESQNLVAVSAKAIINIFTKADFSNYLPSLEATGAVDNLTGILLDCDDPMVQTNISTVLAKLAEFGNPGTVDKVLQTIPLSQLADLLSPTAEEWHDSVFTILMSLIRAGKSKAVERMFASKIDKRLIKLLEDGSDVSQHHALLILKSFYELGGPSTNGSLGPNILKLLPWQARLRLEKFVLSDQNFIPSTKPQTFDDVIHKMLENSDKQILEAMQDLIPIVEKAGELKNREMILKSPLVERLSELLQGHQEQHFLKIESAFVLMKLACSGGEPCIRKILEYDIIQELVKIMQCDIPELQDSAYATLHQMLFGQGGILILNQMFQIGQIDRLVNLIDSKSAKTREVSLNCVLDVVEVGNKTCLERMFSLQLVEKLAKIEKAHGGSGEIVVGFLKGISKCKHLTTAERWVMKQQVVRKTRAALKGHKFETQVMAAIDACLSEGSKGASSSRRHKKK